MHQSYKNWTTKIKILMTQKKIKISKNWICGKVE